MADEKQKLTPEPEQEAPERVTEDEVEVLVGDIVEEEAVAEAAPATPPEAADETCAAASEDDVLACLEERVQDLEKKCAEYLDGWQRCQATFTNYRRRTESEQISLRSAANAALLARLLPVLDDFARAFAAMPEAYAGDAWLDGIRMIRRKLQAILDTENVKPMEIEPGDAFDPLYHQAIFHQETEDFEDGQIIAEAEKGYLQGERVLRPASVVVAKGGPKPKPAASPEEGDAPDEADAAAADAAAADAATADAATADAAESAEANPDTVTVDDAGTDAGTDEGGEPSAPPTPEA